MDIPRKVEKTCGKLASKGSIFAFQSMHICKFVCMLRRTSAKTGSLSVPLSPMLHVHWLREAVELDVGPQGAPIFLSPSSTNHRSPAYLSLALSQTVSSLSIRMHSLSLFYLSLFSLAWRLSPVTTHTILSSDLTKHLLACSHSHSIVFT